MSCSCVSILYYSLIIPTPLFVSLAGAPFFVFSCSPEHPTEAHSRVASVVRSKLLPALGLVQALTSRRILGWEPEPRIVRLCIPGLCPHRPCVLPSPEKRRRALGSVAHHSIITVAGLPLHRNSGATRHPGTGQPTRLPRKNTGLRPWNHPALG
jgi:hypothetical protein